MTKNEIKIGGFYYAKVSGKVTKVKVLEHKDLGYTKFYVCLNIKTGRKIRCSTAGRFRKEATDPATSDVAPRQTVKPKSEGWWRDLWNLGD